MAKFKQRIKARKMRNEGFSVKKIAESLGIAKSTASVWVRDIILSVEQLENLRKSSLKGAELGRLKSALLQKQRWIEKKEKAKRYGITKFKNLNKREFLIMGLALYWAEGSKKKRTVEFCNSDPEMIKVFLVWIKECFNIKNEEIRCCIGINQIHKNRENIVKEYWIEVTKLSANNFLKTSFKQVRSKKIYDNIDTHYGTLSIRIKNPSRIYVKILGLIDGLANAVNLKPG